MQGFLAFAWPFYLLPDLWLSLLRAVSEWRLLEGSKSSWRYLRIRSCSGDWQGLITVPEDVRMWRDGPAIRT